MSYKREKSGWAQHSIYFSKETDAMIAKWQETNPGISTSHMVREALACYFKLDPTYIDSVITRHVHPRN